MLVWYRSVDLPIWFFLHIYPLLKKSTFLKSGAKPLIESFVLLFPKVDLVQPFLKVGLAQPFPKVYLVASNSSYRRLTTVRIIATI
jgi:hypothetical protein